MGIGKISNSFIQQTPGQTNESQFSTAEGYAGDFRDHQNWGPCNEDFAPPTGGIYALERNTGRGGGFTICYAYSNPFIPPLALAGERRIYSSNSQGNAVMTEVFLKNDGYLEIKNSNTSITLSPAGEINIVTTGNTNITSNKTIIHNDLEVMGDIIAQEVTAGGVPYTTHVHEQGSDSAGDSEVDTEPPK